MICRVYHHDFNTTNLSISWIKSFFNLSIDVYLKRAYLLIDLGFKFVDLLFDIQNDAFVNLLTYSDLKSVDIFIIVAQFSWKYLNIGQLWDLITS